MDVAEYHEVLEFCVWRVCLSHGEDLCGHGGFLPELQVLVELEESDGDIFDIAAECKSLFIFDECAFGVFDIEVIDFCDSFVDGALYFGVFCQFEEQVEDRE